MALMRNIFEGGRSIHLQYPLCSPLETDAAAAVDCSGCEFAGILPAKKIVSICKGAFSPQINFELRLHVFLFELLSAGFHNLHLRGDI